MNQFIHLFCAVTVSLRILCFAQEEIEVSWRKLARHKQNCPPDIGATFCLNGGICHAVKINIQIISYCECQLGFFGERCEIRGTYNAHPCPDDREDHFCLNGGECVEDSVNNASVYYCQCRKDFWRDRCQLHVHEISSCPIEIEGSFCKNDGTCRVQVSENNKYYYCSCPPNYGGRHCEYERLPERTCPAPFAHLFCLNGGTCNRMFWKYHIIYSCHCREGYEGTRCEEEVENKTPTRCQTQICHNSGTCYELTIGSNQIYFCSCSPEFAGHFCEIKLGQNDFLCLPHIQETFCLNGGTCYERDFAGNPLYYCLCQEQFMGIRCEQQTTTELKCPLTLSSSLCANGGTCVAMSSSGQDLIYFCKCAEGFTGIACEYSDSPLYLSDACPSAIAKSYCLNNGICYKSVVMEEPGYYCTCVPPYYGQRCELKYPTDSECHELISRYLCTTSGKCKEIELDAYSIYYCDCDDGFYGARCEHNRAVESHDYVGCPYSLKDELCKNGGTCIDIPFVGGHAVYYCRCVEGFYGISCQYPYPPTHTLDSTCPTEIADSFCLNGGTCYTINTDDFDVSYACHCVPSYGGYRCKEKNTHLSISLDISENSACPPLLAATKCMNGGTCVINITDGNPVAHCICPMPYYGEECQHTTVLRSQRSIQTGIEPCPPFKASFCENGGTCYTNDQKGYPNYFCICPSGFFGERCEYKQTEKIKACPETYCKNGGTCYINTQLSNAAYYCVCREGFHGEQCDMTDTEPYGGRPTSCPVNLLNLPFCQNGGTCYVDEVQGNLTYRCICRVPYYGDKCELEEESELQTYYSCPTDMRKTYCQNGGTCYIEVTHVETTYHCSCPAPFYGKYCELTYIPLPDRPVIDECPPTMKHYCKNGGTCNVDIFIGDVMYYCICQFPYYGKVCELEYSQQLSCSPKTKSVLCLNEGLCIQGKSNGHKITWCKCPEGYYGARCEHSKMPGGLGELSCPPILNTHLCKNGGTCVNIMSAGERGTYFCKCVEGFSGLSCEYTVPTLPVVRACPPLMAINYCLHGGTCEVESIIGEPVYFCSCPYPYYGDRCEKKFAAQSVCPQEVDRFLCLNGGRCFQATPDCYEVYNCECAEGYYGARCEHTQGIEQGCLVPFCTELCKNGGTCVSIEKHGICFCKCVEGFYGLACEYPYPALRASCHICPPNVAKDHCQNGGTCCMDINSCDPIYYCICPDPYYGEQCNMRGPQQLSCSQALQEICCLNGGTCIQRKSNGYDVQLCACPKGYYGARCEHINETLACPNYLNNVMCKNGGTCVTVLSSGNHVMYLCQCAERFYGLSCEYVYPPLPDSASSCPPLPAREFCIHGGICHMDTALGDPLFFCVCPSNYCGERCEYECPRPSNCPQSFEQNFCVNGGLCAMLTFEHYSVYFCKCAEGYYGARCEHSVKEQGIKESKCLPPMDTGLCNNGGTCIAITHFKVHVIYVCKCLERFYGTWCEHTHSIKLYAREKCSAEIGQNFCQNGGTCYVETTNGFSVYFCECLHPYFGKTCEFKSPKELSCPWSLDKFLCLNGGVCSLQMFEGSVEYDIYHCECLEGYDGSRCENMVLYHTETEFCSSEVSNGFCLNNGECFQEVIDGQHIYHCDCKENYFGERCQIEVWDMQPCSLTTKFCLNGGRCFQYTIENKLLFRCTCNSPFVGQRCEFIRPKVELACPIEISQYLCLNGGSCHVEGLNVYVCECHGHYYGPRCEYKSKNGENCPVFLAEQFCLNHGTCYSLTFDAHKFYFCECTNEYYGVRCENTFNNTAVEELCMVGVADLFCLNGGTCFQVTVLSEPFYYCECESQFTGSRCEHQLPKELSFCSQNVGEELCLSGGTCYEETVNFSQEYNAQIMKSVTFYYCVCPEDYRGNRCQYKKRKQDDGCPPFLMSNFCNNGGKCHTFYVSGYSIYYCECPEAYSGLRCETHCQFIGDSGSTTQEVQEGAQDIVDNCAGNYSSSGNESSCKDNRRSGTSAYHCPEGIHADFCYNGGTCYQADYHSETIYFCECPAGFRGLRCEYATYISDSKVLPSAQLEVGVMQICPSPLDYTFCQNGGTCFQRDNGSDVNYFCECPEGYTGSWCEATKKVRTSCPFPLHEYLCLNGGSCYQVTLGKNQISHCKCTEEYFGLRCQYKVPSPGALIKRCQQEIEPLFCFNGGICYQSELQNDTIYICNCPEGYTGLRCEFAPLFKQNCPSPVDKLYCLNDGVCVTLQFDTHAIYSCICKEHISGERCEYDMLSSDELCPVNIGELYCVNGGICYQTTVLEEIVYYCDCPEGYWGERCEFTGLFQVYCPESLDIFCLNGGTCYQLIWSGSDIYYCECPDNFNGMRCEDNTSVPLQRNRMCPPQIAYVCQNGGTCYENVTNEESKYFCECPENSWGEKCEKNNTKNNSNVVNSKYVNLQYDFDSSYSPKIEWNVCLLRSLVCVNVFLRIVFDICFC